MESRCAGAGAEAQKGLLEGRSLVRKGRTWDTIEFDAGRSKEEHQPVPSRGRGDLKISLEAAATHWTAKERAVER